MKVGFIGGSSQVGASVAYYLKKYTDIEVSCFIRSPYSRVFFDLLEITCESIDLNNKELLKEKLKNFDAVIDFSYPSGQLHEIPKSIDRILEQVISCLPTNAVFIYMSSIMAYGMPGGEKYIKTYNVARSSYAYIKRKAEKKCLQLGKQYGIKTYNFRLGQVHGFLQSVNSSFREKLVDNDPAFIDGNSGDLTNTVFISSVGEAIRQFCTEKRNPGTYTLVSEPQWTLEELYNYYKEAYTIESTLIFRPSANSKQKLSITTRLFRSLKAYRDILETYVFMNIPGPAIKIKGKYRETEIRNTIEAQKNRFEYIDFNLLGKPDQEVVTNIKSDYKTVYTVEKEMEQFYNDILNDARK